MAVQYGKVTDGKRQYLNPNVKLDDWKNNYTYFCYYEYNLGVFYLYYKKRRASKVRRSVFYLSFFILGIGGWHAAGGG